MSGQLCLFYSLGTLSAILMRLRLATCLLVLLAGVAHAQPHEDIVQPHEDIVVTSDISHFWEAYDRIVATGDSARQYRLLDSLYIQRGTPGLRALMERQGYTPTSYIEAIHAYPRFWASVRPNTMRADEFTGEIEAAVENLRALYSALRPATVYFTVGALNTAGMTLDDVIFVGSESAMADSTVVTDEMPGLLGVNLRAYFDTNPVEHLPFHSVHEYVHTQQGPFGSSLLTVALQEGVAEFVATLATGQPSPLPAVAFGEANEDRVRDRFAAEMFSPNYDDWLYNDFANEFGVRDLGYYVGYAIAERYYERAEDKGRAVAHLIELDYRDPAAVETVTEASGYFDHSVDDLRMAYERSRPRVVRVDPFDDGAVDVEPGPTTVAVTFSEPMSPRFRGFDYGPLGAEHVLRVERVVGWSDDGRTLTVEVALQPGRRHQMELTSRFRAEGGAPLEPYLVDITTR